VQMSGGEGADVGIQLGVGREVYGVRRHFGGKPIRMPRGGRAPQCILI
jgi:hypothetical protein